MDDSLAPENAPTIPQLVFRAAARFGDASALEDGDVRCSFRELEAEALRAARAFIAAGIEPGDRVGVWAPNIAEWIFAAIGLQCAGGVLVTLNTRSARVVRGWCARWASSWARTTWPR